MYNYKDKISNIRQNNNYMLAKTLTMFEWQNLPETIPYHELEKLLQKNGYAFITEVKGDLYAFIGSLGGEVDVYGNPTTITINNIALNFNKTLNISNDGVLVRNDDCLLGLIPLYNKYHSIMVENDINMVLHGYNSRIQTLLSASDDKTKASAEKYLDKIVEGDLGVIGESALFEGIKTHRSGANSGGTITSLVEFQQYMRATLYNEIGLSANFNMKRERLNSDEVGLSEDSLFPFVDNMMKCRLKATQAVNEKYDLTLLVDYGGVWADKKQELIDDIVDEPLDELLGAGISHDTPQTTKSEPLHESLLEPLLESLDQLEKNSSDIMEIENYLLNRDLTDQERAEWQEILETLRGAKDD